ncbi:MAG: TonB-dependent receptor domain-containing protein [Parvularculaceae bacterium]
MNTRLFKLALLSASSAVAAAPAFAQDEDRRPDAIGLDEIVVTATPGAGATKLQSSVSVSDVSPEEIQNFAPRTTSEIFRNIPGIRSESSGGENNANIQVRGLPVTTGGAKFVQLQEDGLPVLSFGDITFGNADNFLRYDWTVQRVEAIRGGSASTFASNAPGAAINFISRTGETEGGSVGVTRGLDFDTTRVDFEYGGPINDNWLFHVGGFYRVGEGARDSGFDGENGGQIKANFTRLFENGFARVYFKHLNDRTIPYLPAPVDLSSGDAEPIPGFDFRDQTLSTRNLLTNTRVDSNGELNFTDVTDGVRAISTAIGGEFEFDLPGDWKISNKVRYSDNRGGFVGTFTDSIVDATGAAAANGGDTLVFANGPNAGQTITDPASLNGNGLLISNLLFDVDVDDLSQFVNDLKLTKTVAFGGGDLEVTGGYYKSVQQVETEWSFNFFLQEAIGDNAALVDVVDSTAPDGEQVLSVGGVTAFGIFDPFFDLSFDRDAVYGALTWTNDVLTLDASLRYEDVTGTGLSNLGAPAGSPLGGFTPTDIDVNADGFISPAETGIGVVDRTNLFTIDYGVDYIAYSFGANYLLTDDLAVFARYSRGGVANGDRLVLGGTGFNSAGGLIDEGLGVDIVNQAEVGVKYRTDDQILPGSLSLFLTGFYADSEESNFEVTSGLAFDRTVEAFGIELESAYTLGAFSLVSGLTWTDAEIEEDNVVPANVGNTPRRQADVTYQITPSFNFGRNTIGANIVGTTSSFAQDNNDLELPGFAQVNLFLNVEIAEGLIASVNVNNVNNAFGLTEAEEGSLPPSGLVRARPINGRTTTFSLRYEF